MQPLPPEAVAGIDQRSGECNAMLDNLLTIYRTISEQHGTAGAVGVVASELWRTNLKDIGNVVDVLAFAVARLAEKGRS